LDYLEFQSHSIPVYISIIIITFIINANLNQSLQQIYLDFQFISMIIKYNIFMKHELNNSFHTLI
jgi:hypothetical protein